MADHGVPDEREYAALVRSLLEDLAGTPVTRLELRQGDLRVELRRLPGLVSRPLPAVHERGAEPAGRPAHWHAIEAPLTGIYYARPAPDAEPFVRVGGAVEEDTVIGLIEAMKMFNEVTAGISGTVREVVPENGALVEAGKPILYVELGDVIPQQPVEGI